MKKLLGISLVAVLAATPLMAFAAAGDIDKDPGATVSENAPVAASGPKYGLAPSDATDANAASAGYVKGAYNAAIRAINSVDNRIDTVASGKQNALTAGDGIDITDDTVSVDLTTNGGLQVNGTTKKLEVVTDGSTIVKDSTTGALGVAANTFDAYGAADTAEQNAENYADTNKVDKTDIATSLTAQSTDTQVASAKAVYDELADKLEETDFSTGTTAGTIKVGNTDVAVNISGFATETGVENTVKNTINNVTLTQGTVTNGVMQGELNATSSTIATIMTEWGSTTSTTPITAVTAVDKGTLASNVTVAAPTINTVSTVTYTEQ